MIMKILARLEQRVLAVGRLHIRPRKGTDQLVLIETQARCVVWPPAGGRVPLLLHRMTEVQLRYVIRIPLAKHLAVAVFFYDIFESVAAVRHTEKLNASLPQGEFLGHARRQLELFPRTGVYRWWHSPDAILKQ